MTEHSSLSDRAQNTISLGILLLVLGVVFWISPTLSYTSHGIYLPQTQTQYSPSSTLHIGENPPADATEIGVIRTAIHFDSQTAQALERNNLNNMKKVIALARAHGANWIVGHAGMTAPGEMDAQVIYATAYRVHTGDSQ